MNQPKNNFNLRVLLLLSLGHLITDIYQGSLPALLPFLKEKLMLNYTMTASIMMVANLTSSVVQPIFGYWSDKKEKKFLLPLGCFCAGLGLSLVSLSSNYYSVLLLVIISGLGVASYHPEGYKTAHFFTGDRQATGMSVFSVGGNLGFALGPIISVYLVTYLGLDYLPLMLSFSLIFVVLIAIYWKAISQPKATEIKKGSTSSAPNTAAYIALFLVIFVVITRSWTQIGLMTFLPFYYIDFLKGDPLYAGKLISVFLLGGVIGTIGGSILSDRIGHYIYLTITLFISTLLFPFLFKVHGPWLFLMLGTIGLILISSFTVTIVMAQQLLPRNLGIASGLMVGFAIGTGGIGATLIGIIADHFGVHAALQSINSLPFIGFIVSIFLMYYVKNKKLLI